MAIRVSRPGGGGGGASPPLFSDDFAVDSRANYTFPSGLNLVGGGSGRAAVSAGTLKMAASDGQWSVLYPTSLTAADTWVAKMKVNIAASGQVYTGLLAKVLDGDNYCGFQVDTDGPSFKYLQVLGGVYSATGAFGTPTRSTDLWMVVVLRGGNMLFCLIYLDDPETPGARIQSGAAFTVPAGLASGHPGRPGISLAGNSAGAQGTSVDDFKAWAGNALVGL